MAPKVQEPTRGARRRAPTMGILRSRRISRLLVKALAPASELQGIGEFTNIALLFIGAFSISFAFSRVYSRLDKAEQRLKAHCTRHTQTLEREYHDRLTHLSQRHTRQLEVVLRDLEELHKVRTDLAKMKAVLKRVIPQVDWE